MAVEFASMGVRVNAVGPGTVLTEGTAGHYGDEGARAAIASVLVVPQALSLKRPLPGRSGLLGGHIGGLLRLLRLARIGCGEIFGGALAPFAAGMLVQQFGIDKLPLFAGVVTGIGFLVSLIFMKEPQRATQSPVLAQVAQER